MNGKELGALIVSLIFTNLVMALSLISPRPLEFSLFGGCGLAVCIMCLIAIVHDWFTVNWNKSISFSWSGFACIFLMHFHYIAIWLGIFAQQEWFIPVGICGGMSLIAAFILAISEIADKC